MNTRVSALCDGLIAGDFRALARVISLVENEHVQTAELLANLTATHSPNLIGITGAPGAGKSTLTDAIIRQMVQLDKSVAVLCVDPSSSFHHGALLGDRIRMSEWYTNPKVFIRSLATRGALGGLHPRIIEISTVMQAAAFDYIIIETVGVGQSEIEIAGLADLTVVVLVPEGGDDIQAMKAGLMEIADLFVVNKSDRPGADIFLNNLRRMLSPEFHLSERAVPVLKTNAITMDGVPALVDAIMHGLSEMPEEKRYWILAERAYRLILQMRMNTVSKRDLELAIKLKSRQPGFNLYAFATEFNK